MSTESKPLDSFRPKYILAEGSRYWLPSYEVALVGEYWHALHPDTLSHHTHSIRVRAVCEFMRQVLTARSGERRVLDVGSESGRYIYFFNHLMSRDQQISYVGVDIEPEVIDFSNEFAAIMPNYQNCSFMVGNLEKGLPFPDNTFDAINFCDIIEHMPDPAASLAELARVLKPGGSVIVSTPLRESFFKALAKTINTLTGGRLYKSYYGGKDAAIGDDGKAIMEVRYGHDHISEMTYKELMELPGKAGLEMAEVKLMPVMSGSKWFNLHPFLLATMFFIEAVQDFLKIPYFSHAVVLRYSKPDCSKS